MSVHLKQFLVLRFIVFSVLIVFTMPSCYAADHGKLARTALEKHIRPGYKALSDAAIHLENQLKKFCTPARGTSFANVQQAFKIALLAWGRMEHIRFGPITVNNRYERFAYWPDRKGRGLRQVKNVLVAMDLSVLSLPGLAKKSVALQGFTALEYLLYGKGYKDLWVFRKPGQFRCQFAYVIAQNLAQMARDVFQEWQQNANFLKSFLRPDEKLSPYRKPDEVTLELFQAFVVGLEQTKNLKILYPLGLPKGGAKPRRAAFWRSQLSIPVISENIKGLREMFLNGGFADLVSVQTPGLKVSVSLAMTNALRLLEGLNGPVKLVVHETSQRSKLKFVASILGTVRGRAGKAIIDTAGLTIGFNAKDGD